MHTPPPRIIVAVVAVVVVLAGALVAVLVTRGSDDAGGGAVPLGPDGELPAITVSGDQILRGGQPWWFLGYNSFVWSGDCGREDERMSEEQVDEWFSSMRHDGHGAVRLFFFDGWDMGRLDAAVASAKRNNIYVTITLDDAIAECGESEKDAAWFDDAQERATYRAHMTSLLERFRGDTTIAWFEYFNEPEFVDGKVREFYDEMGAVADSIDPDRLFSSGTIAPYGLDGEENYRDLHESPGVDIASLHEYDENEVESNHGPGARAASAGKPVIVGEFGIEASDSAECGFDFARRAEQFQAKVDVYIGTEGYAGALAWAWQPENADRCKLENIEADPASQAVLRDTGA